MELMEKKVSEEIPVGYKKTEVGVIPEDWNLISLKNLGVFLKGKGIKKDEVTPEGLACVRYGELYTKYNSVIKNPISFINEKTAISSFKLKYGDLLFAGSGETKEEIGKSAVILNDEVYAGGDIVILRCRNVNHKFLGYISNSKFIQKQKSLYGQGDAVVHIYSTGLGKIKIPLPPTLAEQEAIANALSDVDDLISSLDKLIQKKKLIKQGAMQELLTPPSKGGKRLKGFDGEWVEKKLGDLGECIIGLTYSPTDVSSEGTLVLRSSNIQNNQWSFKDNVFVNKEIPERLVTQKGDILVCVRNGSRNLIGKCAQINDDCVGQTFGAFMSIFRSSLNDYLVHCFSSASIQKQIEENLGATINQITNGTMNSFLVWLPQCKEEQQFISGILSDMDAEIEKLQQKKQKYQKVKQGMMQELLTGRVRLV